MKLLLHCCCAPCSISCVKALGDEKIIPQLFWYNPNIHPLTEYEARRNCIKNFADNEKLELSLVDEYGLRSFLTEVSQEINKPSPNIEKCEKCYRIRLEKTAAYAAKNGFSAFSTTLLISPYQNHDVIKKTGEDISAKYSVDFFYRDFRPLFREGQSSARAKEMYMQKYCGCIFSEEERYLKVMNEKSGINNSIKKQAQIQHSSLLTPHSFFDRLTLLTGKEGFKKLKKTSVLVFGLGGVGSWAAEALVRSGIGKIGIIDSDTVCASNVNRQIQATSLTLGLPKASCLKKRLLEIYPECEITAFDEIFCIENAQDFNMEKSDYVIDAIDTINHKLDLIETTVNSKVTLFSSMGMALKIDPLKIKTASIWKTDICPLARIVRQGLRKRGFQGDFTAVYSVEPPMNNMECTEEYYPENTPCEKQKKANGSIVTVTAAAGLMLASLVINDTLNKSCETSGAAFRGL